jgi:general secretion pathway protein K
MLLLLSLLAASFVVTRRSDLEIARNVVESARARALADAGVARAAVALGEIDPQLRWRADGSANRWAFGGGTIIVSITGENGKIDINVAPAAVLVSLFHYVGAGDDLSAQFAQEILDRRTATFAAPLGTAGAAIGFDPTKPAFATTEELGGLAGMTAAVLHAVLPLVTVYSGLATIDPDAAPRAVLLSLPGANEAEIDAFLAARGDRGQSNSVAVAPPASIASYLAPTPVSAVTIRASATTDTGAAFVREALVLLRGAEGSPFVVERWAQGVAAQ